MVLQEKKTRGAREERGKIRELPGPYREFHGRGQGNHVRLNRFNPSLSIGVSLGIIGSYIQNARNFDFDFIFNNQRRSRRRPESPGSETR